MQTSTGSGLRTILVSYLDFIGLGITLSLLGIAWPTMQKEFGVPLDAVGILLLASTVGYLSASFLSGTMAYRFGAGRMFACATGLAGLALLAVALVHSWLLLIVIMLFLGFGNGTMDGGINAYIAQHHSARAMNWLHGSFGIGVTVGPLIMTAVITSGTSWRVGYLVACGVMVAVTVLFLVTLSSWVAVVTESQASSPQRKSVRDVLRMPVVWFGIALFIVYVGLEATPGTWIYTLFTQSRNLGEEASGLWVSIYWGSFTIGRFFFGAIISRLNTLILLRFCMVGVIIGAFLLWWNPVAWAGFFGLTLLGFMEAPLFPVFVSDTPKRVGMENAGNAIGFQVAGGGIGIAMIPALAGLLANHISLEIIPPFIFIGALLVIVLHELSVAEGTRTEQRRAAQLASAGD